MINSYKEITWKYLKSNKKRTICTIIAVILSVAIISCIGLFIKGTQKVQIENIKQIYGSYHLVFSNLNDNLILKLKNNPRVVKSGLLQIKEKVKLNDKISVDKVITTDQAISLLPVKLKRGRFPKNEKEVAVESWMLDYIDKNGKIDDKVNINNKKFILVGILDDNINNQLDNHGLMLIKSSKMNINKAVMLVKINQKVNLKKSIKELKKLGNEDSVGENTRLIVVQAGNNDIWKIVGIIIVIVVVASIAVIYNAFQMSIIERIKQFGLLRAIGTIPSQIKKIVFREATLIALIGVPIGLVIGIIAIYLISIVFKIIGGENFTIVKITISPIVLEISAIIGLISIYISALFPSISAGKVSPLVAISSNLFIKKENIKRRNNAVIRKLFGFEGEMAFKNIKRNRKRYRITVFSIIISVVLFITFKSFMSMALNIQEVNNESKKINFSVNVDNKYKGQNYLINDKLINQLKKVEHVEKIYKTYDALRSYVAMDKEREIKQVRNIGVYKDINYKNKDMIQMGASISIYDSNAIKACKNYIKSGNIDINRLNDNEVIVVNKSSIWNPKTKKVDMNCVSI